MAVSTKPVKQRVPAAERRDALIDAAIEEFALTGLHGTPVERIAKRVGVAQPYVFSLFPTKRELFIAAVERGFDTVAAAFTEAAAAFNPQTAEADEDALTAIGAAYVEMLGDDHTVLMLQLQAYAACSDPVIREHVNAAYDKLTVHIAALAPDRIDEMTDFLAHGVWLSVRAAMGSDPLALKAELMAEREDGAKRRC